MDYIESFKNLRTNQKYGRKSPHKAVMMLTVIELFEQNILTDNEIFYNNILKSTFLRIWNKVLPNERLIHSEAYLPFWYLQSDSFWHIVPVRGKEDILSLMRDPNINPSEAKLNDSVRCVELDEDLYFLMTLSSGRSSLKKALLETYTDLSRFEIIQYSMSKDNMIDYSESALDEYKEILSSSKKKSNSGGFDSDMANQFRKLSDDLQIVLCYEYYAYLKSHYSERGLFREILPSPYNLYDHIAYHPFRREDLSPAFLTIYDNFLSGLRVSLMSEDNAFDLIDKISEAINHLSGSTPISFAENESESKEKENTYKDENYEQEEASSVDNTRLDYYIENHVTKCEIFSLYGNKLYSSDGKLKIINDKLYRFKLQNVCFTIKEMVRYGLSWQKGQTIVVAYVPSALIKALSPTHYDEQIEDIVYDAIDNSCRVLVDGVWYQDDGSRADSGNIEASIKGETTGRGLYKNIIDSDASNVYEPKGKLRKIKDVAYSSYDYLWTMSIVEFMQLSPQPSLISYDMMACMMIAIGWELLNENKDARRKEKDLRECIEFLIEESKEEMDSELSWDSPRSDVYRAIKDFPMGGVFENTVDNLIATSPINVLRAWFSDESEEDIFDASTVFEKSCLYALKPSKHDPYIEVNKSWKRSLYKEHDDLMAYLKEHYFAFLEEVEVDDEEEMETSSADIYVELTRDVIEQGRTPNGGFTKSQLSAIGIDWPPQKDWIESTIGKMVTQQQLDKFYQIKYVEQSSKRTRMSSVSSMDKNQEQNRINAILRAMSYFYVPASIRDITRTISRTAWGGKILEDDVKKLIDKMDEIRVDEEGKYILKQRGNN